MLWYLFAVQSPVCSVPVTVMGGTIHPCSQRFAGISCEVSSNAPDARGPSALTASRYRPLGANTRSDVPFADPSARV